MSPVAQHEQAVTLARVLRLLEVSRQAVVFELCRQYGYENANAVAIVREGAVRDPRPTTRRCLTRRR